MLAQAALTFPPQNAAAIKEHIESVEDQQSLRQQIGAAGLAAFVRDGAILPRASGDTDTPMAGAGVVAFRSPDSMRREFVLPNRGAVAGMAIPRGVTLIVGGGFHGKSTLLQVRNEEEKKKKRPPVFFLFKLLMKR